MKPGTTARLDCDDCGREFEVTLEPKLKPQPDDTRKEADKKAKEAAAMEGATVIGCPFCGAEIAMDNEEGDEE